MEEAPPDIKRRRIVAADGSPQRIRCLTDLPSGILAHAASFLAEPSKALFAVALDGNSAASTNERSAAIVGNEWATLDFGEIEKELAIMLKDEDIERVLQCIDAVNKVKRLKLANCVNITGAGLEPLRGSLIIEQIDLGLVGAHQSPKLYPEPSISCNHVLPILDTIIATEGCALRHLQFPLVWLQEPSTDSEFHQFLQRYNQMWANRGTISCLECNKGLPVGSGSRNEWIGTDTHGPEYGQQYNTCYGCFKHYCYDCKMNFCSTCQMDYCDDCTKMSDCQVCGDSHCNDCCEHECHECNAKICSECVKEQYECYGCVEGQVCHICGDCDRVFCSECCNFEPGMISCEECTNNSCDDCRLRRFLQGEQDCAECNKRIAPLIVRESIVSRSLKEEVESLKAEVKELKHENKELRSKNWN
uniref:Uncharacterized protein n=1 Tax=Skeletonema marinoi TaxID=267567 RepID=A0A7S2P2B5_9STRA|mmetsp:Transcript_10970/g.18692  ORF Transcript_10970/g.18692 Transcript_10970/m.18692 type:complete len:418 (+) Transcript_10970:3-1256(+)